MLTRKMRVSVVGSLLFSRFTAYLSPFSLVPFCNTEISEFFDMENSEQLFVARAPKNVTDLSLISNVKCVVPFYVLTRAIIASLTS